MSLSSTRAAVADRMSPLLGYIMVLFPILAVCVVVGGAWEFTRRTLDLATPSEMAAAEAGSHEAAVQLRHLDRILRVTESGLVDLSGVEWRARVLNGMVSAPAQPATALRPVVVNDSSTGWSSMLGLAPAPEVEDKYFDATLLTRSAVSEARRLRHSFSEVLDRMRENQELWATIPSIHPLDEGPMTSRYGYRRDPFTGRTKWHDGVDFSASTGTPIRASADGTVIRSGWFSGYGKMVELDHGNGLTTLYAHTSRTAVKNGDAVRRGQVIGYVGRTGRASASHLHYEVRLNGRGMNPQSHLFGSSIYAD